MTNTIYFEWNSKNTKIILLGSFSSTVSEDVSCHLKMKSNQLIFKAMYKMDWQEILYEQYLYLKFK